MPVVCYEGQGLEARPEETVLECLERHGVPVVSSCRSGVCQSCVLCADSASLALLPASAQAGLKTSRKKVGAFLACQCPAIDGLSISHGSRVAGGRISRVEPLGADVFAVFLSLANPLEFRAGQFILLRRSDQLARPYSIASLAGEAEIELHVARVAGGRMSSWLPQAVGESIEVVGPQGDCIYLDHPEDPLVLAGTGSGLAPLLGVIRSALAAGHRGPIQLFHGAPSSAGLYYRQQLLDLKRAYPRLEVSFSVLSGDPREEGIFQLPLEQLVIEQAKDLKNGEHYLCGNPAFVQGLRRRLYLAGASLDRIHADPFAPAA